MRVVDRVDLSGSALSNCKDVKSPTNGAIFRHSVLLATAIVTHVLPCTLLAIGMAVVGRSQKAKSLMAQHLVSLLQVLGPAFLKAGQILGTRRDVLPKLFCDELALIQDAVRPLSPRQSRTALVMAYGPQLKEIFASIDYSAVASGSIACVYRARLRDGQEVALKLQRPGIAELVASDLAVIRRVGAILAPLPFFRLTPLRDVLDQLCHAVYEQINFARESEYLLLMHRSLSRVPRVWVPRVIGELSRDSVIVMEFVPGLEVCRAQQCSVAVRKRFAATALAAVYHMLFVDGLVHCDLHPGNLYFRKTGDVVILDAGFSVRMSDRMRRLFGEFFLKLSLGDSRRCAEIVIESADRRTPDADVEGFGLHLADLVRRNSRLSARDFSLLRFAGELFEIQREFGLRASAELIYPLLCLLTIEGTIRDLDPDVDFQKAAETALTQGIFGSRP